MTKTIIRYLNNRYRKYRLKVDYYADYDTILYALNHTIHLEVY